MPKHQRFSSSATTPTIPVPKNGSTHFPTVSLLRAQRPPGKSHAGFENPAKKRLTPDHVSVKLPQVNPKQKAILPEPRSVKKAIPYQFSRKA